MGQFHIDPECDQLMQQLADALVSFERQTGRENALVFIPCSPDEKVILLANGKIMDKQNDSLDTVLNWARYTRRKLPEKI